MYELCYGLKVAFRFFFFFLAGGQTASGISSRRS